MQQLKTLLVLVLALVLTSSVFAQTKALQKDVKKAYKAMTEAQQEALIKYANLGLAGKEEGVAITDKKSLNKYFKMLPPKHQEQVLTYAQSQLNGTTPAVASAPAPARPAKPAQVAPKLNGNSSMVEQAPVEREVREAPAAPARPAWMVKAESMPKTSVEWYEQSHDFGQITEGDVVTHTFRFKNVGDNPLQLTRVKPSCGCTSPEWSDEPIAPGDEGLVTVSFNSSHKRGMQSKSVVITFNGNPINKVLTFRAEVKPKAPAPASGN
jgi:hypothetical protein